jgi:predicted transcriptional regulator
MDNFSQHVPKPGATQAMNIVTPPVGVQRNRLTLYLSLSAILLSVASAAVSLYVFLKAGENKMVAETVKAEVETQLKQIEVKLAPSLLKNQIEPLEAQKEMERTTQQKNRTEAEKNIQASREHSAGARVKESELEVYNSVTNKILPDLAESAKKGARGDLLYNPPSSVIPPAPRGGSDPYGVVPGMALSKNGAQAPFLASLAGVAPRALGERAKQQGQINCYPLPRLAKQQTSWEL